MKIQTLKKLIDGAMESGKAEYQAWRIDFRNNELLISHNGGPCAHFVIQGYEKGYMVYDGTCSATESLVLDQIDLYMLGELH
ncbi:hypothetical protein [Lactococcus kimchii]|uniref:hypothetical protein n=1 Tax=Lactococcus sp. S-13 TaxID=2507158 RepID=UPI0010238442|nr:hypothetical protein [Lactococcus sp. S-13]RZI49230.1 hypothetical protein EQJ87_07120 [Lactococcus sp. S-13]